MSFVLFQYFLFTNARILRFSLNSIIHLFIWSLSTKYTSVASSIDILWYLTSKIQFVFTLLRSQEYVCWSFKFSRLQAFRKTLKISLLPNTCLAQVHPVVIIIHYFVCWGHHAYKRIRLSLCFLYFAIYSFSGSETIGRPP